MTEDLAKGEGSNTSASGDGAPEEAVSGALVDPTLLQATLAMTVRERLLQNDRMIRTVHQLRAGVAALRGQDNARTG